MSGKKVITKSAINKSVLDFSIRYPLLWLGLAVLIVYFPTFYFKFTELDDSIFIRDFRAYNEDLSNLVTSFSRGLFDAVKDPYYRPLFLDSMILNYKISGEGENIASYHVVNVLFHLLNVLLLYKLFCKLEITRLHAFVLSLIFAVHPVLSQAVAWIPGRNDTLLALFIFSFFIYSINYTNSGKMRQLVLSAFFLLLAFFTKETAVIAAPVAFVLLVFVLKKEWRSVRIVTQYGVWFGCFLIWFLVRLGAHIQSNSISAGQLIIDFFHRLPVIFQYLGKIFFPFNLSVFPMQEDTVYYFGIAAVVLLSLILFLYKQRDLTIILSGLGIFLLFLTPVLLVPNKLNEQIFEHRLYLPVIGILLLLPQTVLFHFLVRDRDFLIAGAVFCLGLGCVNYHHMKHFADPLSFWSQAAETSPHSAYANMMLGAREDNLERSYELFRKAYQLNPKEKYLNFYYGVMLQKQDSVQKSEKYLLEEKNSSGYYECDFYLARVAMERKDYTASINYLKTYLTKDPNNKMANINLLLLYMDTNQADYARAQAKHMLQVGMDVQKEILQRLGML